MRERHDEVALADDAMDLRVVQRLAGLPSSTVHLHKSGEAVGGIRVVVDVGLGRDELVERGGRCLDERFGQEATNARLVGFGEVEVGDLGRAVDLGVSARVRSAELVDHVPMLDDLLVAVGVEQVGGDPAGLTVVDVLRGLDEHEPSVDEGPNQFDVADRVALDEHVEELDEPLDAVADAGRVLGVSIARVSLDGAANVAVADALEVQPAGVIESGRGGRRDLDATVHRHRGGVDEREVLLGGRGIHERRHRRIEVPRTVPPQRDVPEAVVDGGHSAPEVEARLGREVLGLDDGVRAGELLGGHPVLQAQRDVLDHGHDGLLAVVASHGAGAFDWFSRRVGGDDRAGCDTPGPNPDISQA